MKVDPNEIVESYCRNWNGAAPYVRATIVRTDGASAAKAGTKAIVTGEGELIGWLGGGCMRGAVLRAAKEAMRTASPKLIRIRPREKVTSETDIDGVELHASNCPSKGSADIFIEPVMPRPPLIVIGANYVAMALAAFAENLDFELVRMASGPGSNHALPLDALGEHPGTGNAFIVVATQGSGDYPALKAALATPAPYVAFVSSLNKAAAMRKRLTADGIDEGSLIRLRAPAGLDIGSETPAEIALSILAEIVKTRRSGVAKGSAP
jgi:xanthine dehydrogenase accessory factor